MFTTWWLLGLALLAALGADTGNARLTLTAPALGACVVVLPTFALNQASVPIADSAIPVVAVLTVAAIVALALRRPALPGWEVGLTLIACLVALLVIGAPMLHYGFDWVANANDDMANYVLGTTQLLHRGIGAPIDVSGLLSGTDYADAMKPLHEGGARPAGETLTAVLSRISGRPPLQAFMPSILAMGLTIACSAAALALQARTRRAAAPVAAALVLLAPMATYGILQQLLGQTLGLAIAPALAALLMRAELYERPGARPRDIVLIGVLVAGLAIAYPEFGGLLGVAYIVFLVLLAVRGRLALAPTARLLIPAAALAVVLVGPYFLALVRFLGTQSQSGFASSPESLFQYMLAPTALPGTVGLQTLNPPPVTANALSLSIAVSAILVLLVVAACAAEARRGGAAGLVGLVLIGFAVLLVARGADFGLFKLTMYAAPFVAAAVAAWLVRPGRWRRVVAAAPLAVLVVAGLGTQQAYVAASRSSSGPDAAAVHRAVAAARGGPVVSAAEAIVTQKLEAASAPGTPLWFITRNPVEGLLGTGDLSGRTVRDVRHIFDEDEWTERVMPLAGREDPFLENVNATVALRDPRCQLILPAAADNVFNSAQRARGQRDPLVRRCADVHDVLVFVSSRLGAHYYLDLRAHQTLRDVSYFQTEADLYRPGERFSAFGRYALFRVIGPTPGARFRLDVTQTLAGDGVNALPPAVVYGATRVPLPIVGRGAARVLSPPITPRYVDGVPYLLLDMGVEPKRLKVPRPGLAGLWGKDIPLDPRYITARVRDLSLLSAPQAAALRAPRAIASFPADLDDRGLEFSGLYDDGWVAETSYAVLDAPAGGRLRVSGEVPAPIAGQELRVLVDGRERARRALRPGAFTIDIDPGPGTGPRRVELRFARRILLAKPDGRPASARLTFIGFEGSAP